MSPIDTGLVWLRRDLRLHDHAALALALAHCRQLQLAFIFDTAILAPLPRADRRVAFIRETLVQIDGRLRERAGRAGCGLVTGHGPAVDEIVRIARAVGAQAVFASHDDEPASLARDAAAREALAAHGIALHTVKDHLVLERRELLTRTGTPYTVFTPYARAWRASLTPADWAPRDTAALPERLAERPPALCRPVPTLAEIGFTAPPTAPPDGAPLPAPGPAGARAALKAFLPRLDAYDRLRDLPAEDATSRLGIHLRFGTLSIRELVALAQQRLEAKNTPNLEGTAAWLNELVWREFFAQIMANFPHAMTGAFRPAYDAIAWETGARADAHFAAWCQGRTGYPIVDAAMRQLAATGFMPGRLRMVTASFLIKDLGLDWRRGEAWFAEKLDDFDLSANNGNWQWVASTGCDAQPWFRIFNPVLQSRRFDPEAAYIRRWLPELARLPARLLHDMRRAGPQERAGLAYPEPLVDHEAARGRTLLRYGAAARATA